MKEEQYYANQWLSRMFDVMGEIEQLEIRKEKILSSMSGVGKYDTNTGVFGGSDDNPTESKNVEYSLLTDRIEKLQRKVSIENARTLDTINKVTDTKLRGMLIGRFINHFSWRKVGEMYYYSKSSSYNYRLACLDAVVQFIPQEAFVNDNKFKSQKDWTNLD